MKTLDGHRFAAAYAALRPLALRVARSVLRDEQAAEDVVQDVFLHLWRRPSAYDPARGSLRAFVVILTRSRAMDRWRSSAVERAALERAGAQHRAAPQADEGPAEPVIRRDRTRRALAAVATLPAAQRDALLLTGLGLSSGEIAQATGVPVSTAKSRVRLAAEKARARGSDAA